MTYCMAFRLDEGLIFLSDTRTNAGVDNVGNYRKLHVLRPSEDRVFVLQSAGSLATTHEVLDRITADLAAPGDQESLRTVSYLHEAAIYIGQLSRQINQRHGRRSAPRERRRSSSAARSPASAPTSCCCIPRATTSTSPTSARSSRSARASTASSCSSSPCTRGWTWRRRPRSP